MKFYQIKFAKMQEPPTRKALACCKGLEGLWIQAQDLRSAYRELLPRLGAKPNEVEPWIESIYGLAEGGGSVRLEGFLVYFTTQEKPNTNAINAEPARPDMRSPQAATEALNFNTVIEKINEILTPQGMARAQELIRSELVDYLREFSDYDSETTSQAYRDFGDSRVAVVYWKRTRSVEVRWILFDEHLRPHGNIWEYSPSRPTGYCKGSAH